MSHQKTLEFASPPDPAGKALQEPRLTAEELEREVGDSESWDEASEEKDSDAPAG